MALSCNKGEKELEDISFAEAQNLLMIVGGGSQSISSTDPGISGSPFCRQMPFFGAAAPAHFPPERQSLDVRHC